MCESLVPLRAWSDNLAESLFRHRISWECSPSQLPLRLLLRRASSVRAVVLEVGVPYAGYLRRIRALQAQPPLRRQPWRLQTTTHGSKLRRRLPRVHTLHAAFRRGPKPGLLRRRPVGHRWRTARRRRPRPLSGPWRWTPPALLCGHLCHPTTSWSLLLPSTASTARGAAQPKLTTLTVQSLQLPHAKRLNWRAAWCPPRRPSLARSRSLVPARLPAQQ